MQPLTDITLRRAGLQPPRNIEVWDTGDKGLGVFATCDFQAGDLIEACPVVVLPAHFALHPGLKDHVFNWQRIANWTGGAHGLALGYGSLYNGANPANMRHEVVKEAHPLMQFFAARLISAGEELTVNYSSDGEPTSPDNRWFEERGIKMLPPSRLPWAR